MGSKHQTTTTQRILPPYLKQGYAGLVSSAQSLANRPLNQYQGNLVAGFTPLQEQGFQGVSSAQGSAQPYIDQAGQYARLGASPITLTPFSQGAVDQYQSPYTNDVVNATLARINEQNAQQQNSLVGQGAAAGAYGGDRSAIAQAALAGQQDIAKNQTISGLYDQAYRQALGQFNTAQGYNLGAQQASDQAAQSGAFTLGNLGNEALNTQLTGAGAALNAGAQQQQLAQENLNVPYEQFLQQQAYPYQQLGFLGGVYNQAANALGGSSTTQPGPSLFSQIAGLGFAAAPYIFPKAKGTKAGGTIHGYADGGSLDDDIEPVAITPRRSLGDATAGLSPNEMPQSFLGQATHAAATPSPAAPSGFDYKPPPPDWRRALLTAGLATMAGTSPFALTNIGRGLQTGLDEYQRQEDLDRKPIIDKSGPTQRIFYPGHPEAGFIDTLVPTEAALNAKANAQYRGDMLAERQQYHQDSLADRVQAEKDAAANRAAQSAGTWSMIGTEPGTGKPIYMNNRTVQTRVGNAPIAAKPGGMNGTDINTPMPWEQPIAGSAPPVAAPRAVAPVAAVPALPAGVPASARYSPSQHRFWWQNNGQWQSAPAGAQ